MRKIQQDFVFCFLLGLGVWELILQLQILLSYMTGTFFLFLDSATLICGYCYVLRTSLFIKLLSLHMFSSDWNPHADLQAMARAHRLGQINKV